MSKVTDLDKATLEAVPLEDLRQWDAMNQHDYTQALINHDADALARINDDDTLLKTELIRRATEAQANPDPPKQHTEELCSCGEPKGHPRGYYRG